MMPLNYNFRQMLLKYIRQLNNKKIDQYERKLARQEKLSQEKSIIPGSYLHIFNNISTNDIIINPGEKLPFISIYPQTLNKIKDWLSELKNQYQIIIDNNMEQEKEDAAKIFKSYEKCFNATHKLWVAQREYAFAQGNFCQIPTTVKNIYEFIKKAINYRIVQLSTFFILFWCRCKYALYCIIKAIMEIHKMIKKINI